MLATQGPRRHLGSAHARPPPDPLLTIPEMAKELATSEAQISALVKRGNPPALRLGGREPDEDADVSSYQADDDYRQEEGGSLTSAQA